MDIYPAELVVGLKGRDAGRYFAVIEIIDRDYILICDGKTRKTDKPKKKKIKHVKALGFMLDSVKDKLETNKKISNSDVRKAIRAAMGSYEISKD